MAERYTGQKMVKLLCLSGFGPFPLNFMKGPQRRTQSGLGAQPEKSSADAVVRGGFLAGNVNFARAREGLMSSELLGAELEQCFPLMEMDGTSGECIPRRS